jgi:hypothetical protein
MCIILYDEYLTALGQASVVYGHIIWKILSIYGLPYATIINVMCENDYGKTCPMRLYVLCGKLQVKVSPYFSKLIAIGFHLDLSF